MDTHGQFDTLAYGASSSGNAGVASLDPPLVQQTKSEIRTLAAEMAELAHSVISTDEFYDGFLPRLCVAMGATAAAAWQLKPNSKFLSPQCVLAASHALPDVLREGSEPSQAHAKILQCVVAEGQPILVPPCTVTVEAERPTNPLSESLIIVPVRIEQEVAYLLEVVQKPSGGPAAQRGYLRFVAQMADLMADFLRREQLRALTSKESRLARLEHSLLNIAGAGNSDARYGNAADSLAELTQADYALILSGPKRLRVRGVSGASKIDPRSEIVLNAIQLTRATQHTGANDNSASLHWYHATDRRSDPAMTVSDEESAPVQNLVDTLCSSLRARRLLQADMGHGQTAWMAYVDNCVTLEQNTQQWEQETLTTIRSIGALVNSCETTRLGWLSTLTKPATANSGHASWWISRVVAAILLLAVAFMPVSQTVSVTAILQPQSKHVYYAPMQGEVIEVNVREGQTVASDALLLKMRSTELERQIAEVTHELELAKTRLGGIRETLRGAQENRSDDRNRLEGEESFLKAKILSTNAILERLKKDETSLEIVATEAGQVATWDVQSNLLHRQLVKGSPLLTVIDPEGEWELNLAVPDFRVGLVADAIQKTEGGARVRYSLSSHPDQLLDAQLVRLSSQAMPSPNGSGESVVQAKAKLDASQLPMKKDGAIVRASIDCGRVPACWLVVRDAYSATSSWIKMLW